MTKDIAAQIAERLIAAQPADAREIGRISKEAAGELRGSLPPHSRIIEEIRKRPDADRFDGLIKLLKKRSVRTMSGVAPVAVLVKPYDCPGHCAFCPTEKDVPKSYLPNEPAVMRAIRCHYDPIEQVRYRLKSLEANGHHPEKIELIVIGGTWSYLPVKYKYWYIAGCFFAANTFRRKSRRSPLKAGAPLSELRAWLAQEQRLNEKASYRLIGITLETRPDYITDQELSEMRALGATRIELGVQAIDDAILKQNLRESSIADIQRATALARDYGFKLTYHYMPGLPGSSPRKDIEMYRQLFSQENELAILKTPASGQFKKKDLCALIAETLPDNPYNPDQIKFYPTVVTRGSLLYRWWKDGKYEAYTDETLGRIITECKEITPPWVRIIRLVRDIPAESIVAGSKISNFRQLIQNRGVHCRCIRCREAGGIAIDQAGLIMIARKFRNAGADEYFLSFESADEATLFGFVRLRLPEATSVKSVAHAALIRELHIYGELARLKHRGTVQHTGLGKQLMAAAEEIARLAGFSKIAVIAGVGVRDYYRHLGYRSSGTYMNKRLSD